MRVLIVEDDEKIAGFVAKGLREAGFAADRAETAEDARALFAPGRYDAAIVDIMLPGMDGLELIERVRASGIVTPILILSARHTVDDRIQGFRTGGDDYLVKPFSFSELLVRLQALIRRSSMAAPMTRFVVGDLELDLLSHEARRSGDLLELQPREFSLLEYMMRNAGRVLSKTMILEHVWDYSFDPQTNVVDVLIWRLRGKVDKEYDTKLIHTIRGVGYVLKETETNS